MKIILQHDQMDCGPSCLAMVASVYGKNISLNSLRENSFITREGVSLLGVKEAAQSIGFECVSAKLSINSLIAEKNNFPVILHWKQNHFVVLTGVKKNVFTKQLFFEVADPAHGLITLNRESFEAAWLSDPSNGIALFLAPTEEFYNQKSEPSHKISLRYLLNYLKSYKKQLALMSLLLLAGSCLTLILPFLTQSLIDKGVNAKNLDLISLLLLAQLGVFFGNLFIEVMRNWLILYVGTKLSITIVSDFLKKILQLPVKFFDTKMIGDFTQRIQDNERIEEFLTSQSLLTFFSIITFSVFFGVLWFYDVRIVGIYLALTLLSLLWSSFWLNKRKVYDYQRFMQRSENQNSVYEILNGVTEMKLNQLEEYKLNEWEKIQKKLFKTNIASLKIDQVQVSGFEFLNQVKNILVTFLAATLVVKGMMTVGELLAISYIIGQLNSPVNQMITFFRSLQFAKLSLERLNEVKNHPTEENDSDMPLVPVFFSSNSIKLNNVSFQYEGPKSPFALRNVDLEIPEGKITAIVGASGSGKTTLMKLLLKFYTLTEGNIFYNTSNLNGISAASLREHCGVVMQDGFIFSDSIARNIATGDAEIDYEKMLNAAKVANIHEYIESLPLKFNTKIGASGNGLSGGQKQRILIARAVYKNPHYIFFDEATSALDAENEKIIHENLQEFFKGKTVLIIAHRLSTVKNADNIVVLKNGEIVEQGTHNDLVFSKSDYFNLVKNQLELGN